VKELKQLLAKERSALIQLVYILTEKYENEIAAIKLFGSKVRGDSTEDSDIDVFIVFDRDVDWRLKDEIYDLIFPINLEYDVFISALHKGLFFAGNVKRYVFLVSIENLIGHVYYADQGGNVF